MSDIATIMKRDPSGAELVKFAEQTADQLVRNNLTSCPNPQHLHRGAQDRSALG